MARKFLLALAALASLVVAALVALVIVVDPNDYKPQIQQQAAAQGIALTLGDIGWSFFPRPAFAVSGVDAVLPMGEQKVPVHLDEASLALGLRSLLAGQVSFTALDVRGGSVRLVDAAGKGTDIRSLVLAVRNLTTDGAEFPLSLAFEFSQDGMQGTVTLESGVTANLSTGQFGARQLQLKLDSTGASLPGGKQQVSLTVASLQFDRAAGALQADGLALDAAGIRIESRLAVSQLATAPQVLLEPLAIRLPPDATLQGKVQWQQGKPGTIVVDLQGDALDLDRLQQALAPPAPAAVAPAAPPPTESQKTPGENRLPLEGLFTLPGEFRIALGTLVANHLTLSDLKLAATVRGSTLTLQQLDASLYGGQWHSEGSLLFANPQQPQLKLLTNVKGVQLSPLLNDAQQAPSKIAAGTLQLDARLSAVPRSKEALLRSLTGNVLFTVDGLVIDELNLEKRACEAAAMLEGKTLGARQWPERTEFRQTEGTVAIQNGVALVAPLSAKLDTLDLKGTGPVDLVASTLDLKLDLVLLNDTQAANFCEVMNPRLAGISWPLRCKGNYATQSGKELCGIDQSRLDKLIAQAAGRKLQEKLGEKLGEQGGKVQDALKGLFR